MRNKRASSNVFGHEIELDGGGKVVRLRTGFLPDGAYLFEDELEVRGVMTAKVITGAAWLLELYELEAGEICFVQGNSLIRPLTNCFGVFYPPFTILQPSFKDARASLAGIASLEPLPADFKSVPLVFETARAKLHTSARQAVEILSSGENHQSIEVNPRASLLSVKAKRLIDENYLVYPSIARVSRKLNVTHEHLSRQFKRDFGMSPSAYLHQLRLADAPLRLARGEEIIDISQSVGYNDLSRFYKQFRKHTRSSPGACRTMLKANRDKTSRS